MTRREEFVSAGVFAALGAVIVMASWRMDRLADRGIEAASVPGLLPGLVGALMLLLALVLAWQARRLPATPQPADSPGGTRRTLAAIVLCVLFAGITLGHGLAFVVEGAIFIFVFTTLFSWREWHDTGRIGRGLAQTLAVAVIASAFISWLFESVFLVRLP
jgi:prepilin signal peptidase PulO-like enzyme (type II secretory pathway)